MAFPNQVPPRWAEGGRIKVQGIAALGVGAVSDINKIVCAVPKNMRATGVRVYQQADITGTGLTMDLLVRTAAGATGSSLIASAVSLNVADAAAGKAGQEATLTATIANRDLSEGQLIEAVFDATSVTAGPGDVLVEIEGIPLVAL